MALLGVMVRTHHVIDLSASLIKRKIGGQLRPHVYSRYPIWRDRFGPDGAMHLIRHEVAHLRAFKELCEAEGITEQVCLQLGETFDAAMSDEAWARLSNALQEMRKDHGDDNDMVKLCRVIDNKTEAEQVTQMKGALAAIMHATGSMSDLFLPLHSFFYQPDI